MAKCEIPILTSSGSSDYAVANSKQVYTAVEKRSVPLKRSPVLGASRVRYPMNCSPPNATPHFACDHNIPLVGYFSVKPKIYGGGGESQQDVRALSLQIKEGCSVRYENPFFLKFEILNITCTGTD